MPTDAENKPVERLRRNILRFLKKNEHRSFGPREIARQLQRKNNQVFRDALDSLQKQKLIAPQKGGRFIYRKNLQPREGMLRVHPRGFGFVDIPDTPESVYLRKPYQIGTALDGDRVRIRWNRRGEAHVTEVLERTRTRAVGTFRIKGDMGWVYPDDRRLVYPICATPNRYAAAEHGDKVVITIDAFDSIEDGPRGRILYTLGSSHDPRVRVLSLAVSMHVRADFSEDVLREADAFPAAIPETEISRRLDLRDKPVFTIDPEDAKDLDDALHFRRLPGGNIEVGVHIADVSHYVAPETATDKEGYERGTSTYLVDRVIPMLPERLSGNLCSLHPHTDKLAYSCIMELTATGMLKRYAITETVIHSQARLSYAEAQQLIEGGDHPLANDVRLAAELADRIRRKRIKEGCINVNLPKFRVLLGKDGAIQNIMREKHTAAHRLVEEWMLLANRTVAAHINKRPFVYRIHPLPDTERMEQLATYIRVLGYQLPHKDGHVTARNLQHLLTSAQGTKEEPLIIKATLYAMSKAVYTANNIGHYGLGFPAYTHFTSPIRRYPDLMVHRLLKHYAQGGTHADTDTLARQCLHCSEREKQAEGAERASVKLKQVEYIQQYIGQSFEGIVNGVSDHGVYVEFSDICVEGMVPMRHMYDGYYYYNSRSYSVESDDSGKSYRLGQAVTVQVAAANPDLRTVDLVFVD